MLAECARSEHEEDVVDRGDGGNGLLVGRRLRFESPAEREQLGGIAPSSDGHRNGGLAAVHQPRSDGSPQGRERHRFHANGGRGVGGGENITLFNASALAGGRKCGEINAVLLCGTAGARRSGVACRGARQGCFSGLTDIHPLRFTFRRWIEPTGLRVGGSTLRR